MRYLLVDAGNSAGTAERVGEYARLLINFDLPDTAEAYLSRMGKSASAMRYGRKDFALNFALDSEAALLAAVDAQRASMAEGRTVFLEHVVVSDAAGLEALTERYAQVVTRATTFARLRATFLQHERAGAQAGAHCRSRFHISDGNFAPLRINCHGQWHVSCGKNQTLGVGKDTPSPCPASVADASGRAQELWSTQRCFTKLPELRPNSLLNQAYGG
jgi:hypothetical protein